MITTEKAENNTHGENTSVTMRLTHANVSEATGMNRAHTFAHPALLGRSVRQVRLRALLSDGTSWERLYTFKEALSTRDAARRALKSKLDLPNGLPPAPIEELALELGYTESTSDSAAMNVWLHKQVMAKLAANGGVVPKELLS